MTSAYENAMSDQQAENYTQTYPVTQNQDARAKFWIYLNTHSAAEIDRTTIVQFWGRADQEMTQRAEAAEARVAVLEHDLEVDDWHRAFIRESERAAQAEKDLETEVRQHQETIAAYKRLEAERDHWINAYHAQEAGYNAAVNGAAKFSQERDELRAAFIGQVKTIEQLQRELEQAQKDISVYHTEIERLTRMGWTA